MNKQNRQIGIIVNFPLSVVFHGFSLVHFCWSSNFYFLFFLLSFLVWWKGMTVCIKKLLKLWIFFGKNYHSVNNYRLRKLLNMEELLSILYSLRFPPSKYLSFCPPLGFLPWTNKFWWFCFLIRKTDILFSRN